MEKPLTPVYSWSTYNSQPMESIKVPINQLMDKENVIYLHNGILPKHKEE
jgi:hypothetical protein